MTEARGKKNRHRANAAIVQGEKVKRTILKPPANCLETR